MSKSVMLRSSDAPTGRKKNRPMRRRAGARKYHAARAWAPSGPRLTVSPSRHGGGRRRPPGENPATLLEDLIHVAVERRQGTWRGHVPPNSGLRSLDQLARDDLDLRDFRDGRHALELRVKGAKVGIPTERAVTPSGDARWQIAR